MNPHSTGRMWTYRVGLILVVVILSAIGSCALDSLKAGPPICYYGGGG